jgi:hypothetical protein
MGEIADTFGQIINDLQRATGRAGGAARFARFGTQGNEAASMLLTLDKSDFALATGRIRAYQHIPYYTGLFVLNRVGNFLIGRDGPVQRAFDSQSEPNGAAWEPISRVEEWWRRNNADRTGGNPDGPILDYTGNLKEIATSESRMIETVVTGQYARTMIGPEHLEGTERFKFFVHQLGSDNGWGMGIRIPARPFFPESPEDLTRSEQRHIERLIQQGVAEGVEERAAIYGRRRFTR